MCAGAHLVDLGQLIISGFQEMEDSFYGLRIYLNHSSFQQCTKEESRKVTLTMKDFRLMLGKENFIPVIITM